MVPAEFLVAGDRDKVKIMELMGRMQPYIRQKGAMSAAGSVASDGDLIL
jgi:hypothetical protein